MGILDGKRAIITGAGQGVGQGIALAFAAEGATVVVAGRTEQKLIDTAAEIERRGGAALPLLCDVTKVEAIEACIERTVADFGGVDILVNNAVVAPLGSLLDVSDKMFDLGFRAGPLAALRFMQRCHPHLKGGGVIINLGSGSALRTDPIGLGAYAAVKESIRVLTRAAAVEWGPDGIRANVLMPLAMSPGMQWWSEHEPDAFEAQRAEVPLGYIGDCETDIGRAAVFLAGPDSRYVTGTTLVVDGGQQYLR